jgi:hypothetical protein
MVVVAAAVLLAAAAAVARRNCAGPSVTILHSFSVITKLQFKKEVTKASPTSLEFRARLRRCPFPSLLLWSTGYQYSKVNTTEIIY